MKMEFHAEIIGHEVFRPDPEDTKRKGIRVKLSVSFTRVTEDAWSG